MAVIGACDYEVSESVKCFTLDSLCELHDIKAINVCKLDVEGFEVEVLKGAQKYLPRIEKFIIEYHSFEKKRQVLEILTPYFNIIHEDSTRTGLIFAITTITAA